VCHHGHLKRLEVGVAQLLEEGQPDGLEARGVAQVARKELLGLTVGLSVNAISLRHFKPSRRVTEAHPIGHSARAPKASACKNIVKVLERTHHAARRFLFDLPACATRLTLSSASQSDPS
jgi:hypothetical protein